MSEVSICNMALRSLSLARITTLEESQGCKPEVKDCALFYPHLRNYVLRDHPWTFAHKRRSLTPFTIPEDYDDKYTYSFVYPSDCIRLRKVFEDGSTEPVKFETMRAPTGEKITLTDAQYAVASYTLRATDPTWFDAEFIEALVVMLSSKLALTLKKDQALSKSLFEQYRFFVDSAQVTDTMETDPEKSETVPWIEARSA